MTRPPSRRVRAAWLTGSVVLLTALPAAPPPVHAGQTPEPTTPASPAEPPGPVADPESADPLRVVIDRLTPGEVPQRGEVRIAGTIRNRSDEPWSNLKAYFLRSTEPITDTDALTAAAGAACVNAGTRVIDPLVEVPDLDPGEQTRFRLEVPRDALELSGAPGVYEVGVHVLGESSAGRVDGADGRACTFLPLVPQEANVALAVGFQLRRHTVRYANGSLKFIERWERTLADGRLRRLLDLGASAGERPLTWVVDAAVLDAAQSVARGNPEVRLAAPSQAGPSDPGDPGVAGDDEGIVGEEGSEDDPPAQEAPQETSAQVAARDWVEGMATELASGRVLALPYGDHDAAASAHRGFADQLGTAQSASEAVLEAREVPSTPVLVPPTGFLPEEVLTRIGAETAVILRQAAVPDSQEVPVLARADGGRVLVVPSAEAAWGPGPGPRRSALAVRQRLLADAALHALSGNRDVLVRLLPPWWDPGPEWRRAQFFRGLDVPWLAAGGLGQALVAPVPPGSDPVAPGELAYPDAELGRELPFPPVAAAARLAERGRTLSELLSENDVVGDTLTRQGLLSASLWSRRRPGLAASRALAAEEIVSGWLGRISVRGPSFVTMSGNKGEFDVTVVNGLDQPVTVGLQASTPNARLSLSTPEPVELPARGRGAMRIDATATDIGIHLVTLQPVTTGGAEVGEQTRLSIRSSQVGLILWIVMGVAGSLLFLLVAIRIVRRVRQRRRTHGPLLPSSRR